MGVGALLRGLLDLVGHICEHCAFLLHGVYIDDNDFYYLDDKFDNFNDGLTCNNRHKHELLCKLLFNWKNSFGLNSLLDLLLATLRNALELNTLTKIGSQSSENVPHKLLVALVLLLLEDLVCHSGSIRKIFKESIIVLDELPQLLDRELGKIRHPAEGHVTLLNCQLLSAEDLLEEEMGDPLLGREIETDYNKNINDKIIKLTLLNATEVHLVLGHHALSES